MLTAAALLLCRRTAVLVVLALLFTLWALAMSTPVDAFFVPLPNAATYPRGPNAAGAVLNATIWVGGSYAPDGTPYTNLVYSPNGGIAWYSWSPRTSPYTAYDAPSLVLAPAATVSTTPASPGFNLMLAYGRNLNGCQDLSQTLTFSPYIPNQGRTDISTDWVRSGAMSTLWMPSYASSTGVTVLFGGTACDQGWYGDVFVLVNTGNNQFNFIRNANNGFQGRMTGGFTTIRQRSVIVLAGGSNGGGPSNQLNDVWLGVEQQSSFIPTWVRMPDAPWSGATTLVSTSNDYLFATQCGTRGPISNDVWMSADGAASWVRVAQGDAFPARTGAIMVAVGRQLFLFGGKNLTTTFNDAWTAWAP